jgi:hypothetical protein
VLPELSRRGIAPLGMKSLGGSGEMVMMGAVRIEEALRYAMSLPVATTISGINSLDILHQNLEVARGFKPMTPAEMDAVRSKHQPVGADWRYELFKTTKKYDGMWGGSSTGSHRRRSCRPERAMSPKNFDQDAKQNIGTVI